MKASLIILTTVVLIVVGFAVQEALPMSLRLVLGVGVGAIILSRM
jgi:hypothetical protein